MVKFGSAERDTFGNLVFGMYSKKLLLEGLFKFLDLLKNNGLESKDTKMVFLGHYQELLFESIILDISYLLVDKIENEPEKCPSCYKNLTEQGKTRMQIELDSVEVKLNEDINSNIADRNYTVEQKKKTLEEIKKIRSCKDYQKAIGKIKKVRNMVVAHSDEEYDGDLGYNHIELAIENVWRCYEIRQLALHNVGVSNVPSALAYDHRNVVNALLLQEEIRRSIEDYNSNRGIKVGTLYSKTNELKFFKEQVKPILSKKGT